MKLILDGKINKTYVQALCMMFFHGEKFPEKEDKNQSLLKVKTEDKENGIYCEAEIFALGKKERADAFVPFSEGCTYEKVSKIAVGKAVYKAGTNLTGKSIPWGILTGVRPSKIASEILLKNNVENTVAILKKEYLLCDSKARLAAETAKKEASMMSFSAEGDCSIYISIPFCPSRCTYCSFVSYSTSKLFSLIPEYLNKLICEIKDTLELINKFGLRVVSIYIGGGTPTVLEKVQLERLLSCIYNSLDVKALLEFTLEAGRPDTITEEKLQIAKKYGISRISVNPQSLNDEVLEKIGRKHTSADFQIAYETVLKSGIQHINTDLIAGLEGDSFESFKTSIDKIVELSPDNITVHTFSVKKSAQILRNDEYIYQKDAGIAERSVDYAYAKLTESGYEPYYMYRQKNTVSNLENVGYSKKFSEGLYNVFMMADVHSIFGIGAAATTKFVGKIGEKTEITRIFSPKYPYEYLQDNQKRKEKIQEYLRRR